MSNVPNTKVMAGGLGGTISGFIVAVMELRMGIDLSTPEINFIVVMSGLLVAYFVPERNNAMLSHRLKAEVE